MSAGATTAPADRAEPLGFVTAEVAGQTFGIAIGRVRDVFVPSGLTPVPLAPPEVAGLVNLRGRILTAIDLRRRLGFPPASGPAPMAVGIEADGEAFAFVVDAVGEVLTVPPGVLDDLPANLSGTWVELSTGILKLDGVLIVVLDVDAVLALAPAAHAV